MDQRQLHSVGEALRAEWRMFERVTLSPSAGGEGFFARVYLNPTIVRGSLEQQGLSGSPAARAAAEARRMKAIADCVERFNSTRPAEQRIRAFDVLG